MIQRLKNILTEQTLEVKVKCVVEETVIDKNFEIIKECLSDLENKQSQFEKTIKEMLERNERFEKDLESVKTTTHISSPLSEELIKVQRQEDNSLKSREGSRKQDNNLINQGDLRDLIKQLQDQISKESEINKKKNLQNIKDINILLKESKELKERVDVLENTNKENEASKESENNNNAESNLENIRILQNQLHKQSEKIDKLQSEVDKLKNKNSNILEKLKSFEGVTGLTTGDQNNLDEENDQTIGSLSKQLEKLTEKVNTYQNNTRQDLRKIRTRFDNADLSLKQLENRVTVTEQDIEQIKQKLLSLNSNGNSESSDKQKLRLEKELKRLEESNKKDLNKSDEWRRRMDEQLKEHTLNIADIQTQLSDIESILAGLQKEKERFSMSSKDLEDKKTDRLPSIAKKNLKLKSITKDDSFANNEIDKKLQELKGELQQWVRSLLDARGMINQDSSKKKDELIDGIDIKLQEIKLILERKADHEGVKKNFTFLDNKINQIWAIMSQPDTEDALIARKGWNCLSCAKRLQKYRGKIGEHVNWNGLSTTNYSPPRVGYSQNVSNNTTQNIIIPTSKPRPANEDTQYKQFP